jgi:predicted PurR-regulated permease PerM
MEQKNVLDVSWETIFKISISAICLYFVYLVKDVLIWFIFAVIISIMLEPLFDFFQKRKIPRVASVLVIYLLIFGIISFLIYLTIPLFVSEIRQFAQIFPQYFEKIAPPLKSLGVQAFQNIENFVDFLSKNLESIATNVFKAASAIFGGILSTFFVFSIAIFMSLEDKPIEKTLILLFPKKYEAYILDLWKRCRNQVSGWFLSRVLGSLFVGILTYISLLIFKTEYPLSLGLLAAALDFVPIIGPIFMGSLIFLIVGLDNLVRAIFVLIIFILVQQIENNIILPFLTKKFTDLSPVLVIMALTVGGILWGIWGAILAIPFFGILYEFLGDLLKKRREEAKVL